MKKFILSLSLLLVVGFSYSQLLFSESFNYSNAAAGDSMAGVNTGSPIWNRHSGGGSVAKAIQYQPSSLTFSGYGALSSGGSITFQHKTRSQDINGGFAADSVGSVYASFILKVDSTGGKDTACDYFFHFCDLAGTSLSNFRGRLFIADGSTPSTFKLGINKGAAAKLTAANITAGAKPLAFSPTEYNVGQSYFVVVKYTFNTGGTKDDEIKLFVLSTIIPPTEPTADVTFVDSAFSDLKKISSVCIRQGSIGNGMGTIDEFRVFTSWSLSAILPTKINAFSAVGLNKVVNLNWNVNVSDNNTSFEIQRSKDGVNFDAVSTVNAFTNKANYSLADRNLPVANYLYYRLKTIYPNGTFDYSTVQKVQIKNVKLTVSPNPAASNILVNASTNISAVEIFNLEGKKVFGLQNTASNSVNVSVANFANGTYVVNTTIDGETSSEKVVIKH